MKHVNDNGNSEFTCDACGEEAFGQVSVHFWYGSKNDMKQGQVHICDDCAEEVIKYLQQKFNKEKFLIEINEF